MSKEKKCCCKKCKTTLIIGGVLFALAFVYLFIAGAAGGIPFSNSYPWGIVPGTGWFWGSFAADPGWTGAGLIPWGNMAWYRMVAVAACYLAIVLFIVGLVLVIKRKQYKLLIRMGCTVLDVFWTGYIFVSMMLPLDRKVLHRAAYFNYTVVLVLSLASVLFLLIACLIPFLKVETISEERIREISREEYSSMRATEGKTYTENEIRAIVREEMTGTQEKIFTESEIREIIVDEISKHPCVVKEEVKEEVTEEPAPEVVEEPVTEEAVEEDEDNPFASLRNKRRASFETKIKNSEYDLRHKYYDLRDYIKSYGINNRISIPGDTFSAKREKLVFITVSGKKLKVSYALDPKEYEQTPIPVEANTSKKLADLPLCLKIKSDLSFRRACKLVDDLMAKKGITKIEEKK